MCGKVYEAIGSGPPIYTCAGDTRVQTVFIASMCIGTERPGTCGCDHEMCFKKQPARSLEHFFKESSQAGTAVMWCSKTQSENVVASAHNRLREVLNVRLNRYGAVPRFFFGEAHRRNCSRH